MKRPTIIIDFSDELARQLSSARVEAIIQNHIETECCVDVKAGAKLLGVPVSAFRRLAKKIPLVDLGECTHRWRLKDVIAYRDKNLSNPKR